MGLHLIFAQADTSGAGAGVVGAVFGIYLVLMILAILATVFWLWMLIDALVNEPTANDKILWFLVIFFLHIIGALIYFIVRRPESVRHRGTTFPAR
jgi:hypothetical protein